MIPSLRIASPQRASLSAFAFGDTVRGGRAVDGIEDQQRLPLPFFELMETIEDGGMAVVLLPHGTATVSRQRAGTQIGLHLSPRRGEPVWLTSPGTYCIVAKDHVVGVRMLKMRGDA